LNIIEDGGENLDIAVDENVMRIARETGRTPREVTSALDFCNNDEEQTRLMLEGSPTELGLKIILVFFSAFLFVFKKRCIKSIDKGAKRCIEICSWRIQNSIWFFSNIQFLFGNYR